MCSTWRSHPEAQSLARTQAAVAGHLWEDVGTVWREGNVLRGGGRAPLHRWGPAGVSSALPRGEACDPGWGSGRPGLCPACPRVPYVNSTPFTL